MQQNERDLRFYLQIRSRKARMRQANKLEARKQQTIRKGSGQRNFEFVEFIGFIEFFGSCLILGPLG